MPEAFKRKRRILVVTESVFSMDGDHAPLREIVQLKDKYGACLMVDEAHATGLYGPRRSGLAEHLDVGAQIEIQMSTLGKALGSSGGCICGSRRLIDLLINRARSFVFSTAPVPAAAAAAAAGIRSYSRRSARNGARGSGTASARCRRASVPRQRSEARSCLLWWEMKRKLWKPRHACVTTAFSFRRSDIPPWPGVAPACGLRSAPPIPRPKLRKPFRR